MYSGVNPFMIDITVLLLLLPNICCKNFNAPDVPHNIFLYSIAISLLLDMNLLISFIITDQLIQPPYHKARFT